MRRSLIGMVVTTVTALVPLLTLAGNQEVAEQVAKTLRASGQLHDYKIGVKYQDGTAWLKGQVGARITLHACDEALAPNGPWVFEPWEEIRLPESLPGGGGTRFTPVFDWVERLDRRPDLLVYFTDAKGEFPDKEPSYPVLWLVKGKVKVPWGQRIQLN